MKTVKLPGIKVDDVGSVWRDLLKKDFDVEAVGVNNIGTFVYMADDEDKDPQPIVESWVGKERAELSRSAAGKMRSEILGLTGDAKKRRVERAAARAEEEAKKIEAIKIEDHSGSANSLDIGGKPISFKDDSWNVIGELMEGIPADAPKEPMYKRIWKALF